MSSSPNLQAQLDVDDGSRKKRRTSRDDDQPPRPMNSFMLFRQDFLKNTAKGRQPMVPSKAAGLAWKKLSPKEKEHWQMLADVAKEEHKRLYPDYRFQPKRREQPAKKRRVATTTAEHDDEVQDLSDLFTSASRGHLEALDNLPFNAASPPASAFGTPAYDFAPLPDMPSLLLDGAALPPAQGPLYVPASGSPDFDATSPGPAPHDLYDASGPSTFDAPYTSHAAPIALPSLPSLPSLQAPRPQPSEPTYARPTPHALPQTHIVLVLRRALCAGCHATHLAAFPRAQTWATAQNDAAYIRRGALCGACAYRCAAVEREMLRHGARCFDNLEAVEQYDDGGAFQDGPPLSPAHLDRARAELFQFIEGDYMNYDACGPA
ncbi:HMG box domain-containing protein [Phanerochaete sordida]|uniref:HMG box domain-containing protein n=1 Tax=Phanerochaete sordida TaxID=48140 RepID=A0A9P3GE61_9APHY|nr:HMG box domain-containing protein [Phanerochaete sordida]